MPIATINPATGELIQEFPALTASDVEDRMGRAEAAARVLRATGSRVGHAHPIHENGPLHRMIERVPLRFGVLSTHVRGLAESTVVGHFHRVAELPFGGAKDSSVGRELAAKLTRESCDLKGVWRR